MTHHHPPDRRDVEPVIQDLIAANALFVVNHSGGKDSQCMFLHLRDIVPLDQLLVIHAALPEVDWEGLEDHIRSTIGAAPLIVTRSNSTFFEMVDKRRAFPSPSLRTCTSQLKRDPIAREIRRYLRSHPEHAGLIVSCMGLRADESPRRARRPTFTRNIRGSVAGRSWYDWLPIHDLTKEQVFDHIRRAGQKPLWVYEAGMTRASCKFCIMASVADLRTAARLDPALYRRYVQTERRLNFTLSMSRKPLPMLTGVAA
jgi:DNA sulfur modification protein DndC